MQGFGAGKPGAGTVAGELPAGIHDMIDQSSYTIAAVDKLAGPGEPQALSYWAVRCETKLSTRSRGC